VRHTDWDELEVPVRLAIEARTGQVHSARTVSAGLNSQLAVVLDTDAGWVFVKGLREDHPGVVRQGREAMINPYVHAVAPRLQWHEQAEGWDLLAFEYIGGARHADYRPDSPDLPRVISAMHDLAAVSCPDLPVKQARQRWAAYVDHEADLDLLDGDALLHTDFNPLNILLGPDRVWIIDWAWPTRGAAFIDAACFLIRAMAAGHNASQAEALVAECSGWQAAPPAAIDVFALASARLYDEIARNDPQPFKQCLASVTRAWVRYRHARPRS
jgi:aminoglycoside/choline kinase family phosphotransferase